MGTMWDKLLINVATGALAGITRLPYGGLYAVPEVKRCALAAVAEGIAVAKALGVKLTSENPEDAWTLAAEGLPAEFKTSMLQSIEKGAATEIDFINGSVVRWGARANVPTPVNQTLVACVKGIELWLARVRAASGSARSRRSIERSQAMAYQKKSYVEHVAVRVRDIDWHIRFFREALGMTIREIDGPRDDPRQVWTVGGVQLMADPELRGTRRTPRAPRRDDRGPRRGARGGLCLGRRHARCRRAATGWRCPTGCASKSSRRPATRSPPRWRSTRGPDDSDRRARVATIERTEAMNMVVEKYWDDAKVGDEGVSPTMTVTGAMIDTYAD